MHNPTATRQSRIHAEPITSHLQRLRNGLLAWIIFLVSFPAIADDISFRLSLDDATLMVTLLGEKTVFYPEVLRMLPDGRWEPLAPKPGTALPAEMLPEKEYALKWTDRPLPSLAPIERLLPLMVRYFEQDGINSGQISFFYAPPTATKTIQAGYANGLLVIEPPDRAASAAENASGRRHCID